MTRLILLLLLQVSVYLPVIYNDLGWKGAGGCTCAELETLGASYGRAWYPEWSLCNTGVVVPELWGPVHWTVRSVTDVAGSGWLLGANEPDLIQPGSLGYEGVTMNALVIAHRGVYEVACRPPCRLGSPAPSHIGGATWLRQWYAAFVDYWGEPPRLDFLDLHCYISPGHDAQDCIDLLREYERFGDEISVPWIVVSETGWPPREYWSRQQAWAEAELWIEELKNNDRVLWVALFACHVDEDAAWAGAVPPNAGWNWNELLSPGGLLTWDGRQWKNY